MAANRLSLSSACMKRAAESARAADVRRQHRDPGVEQLREDLAVAGPRLALGTAVQVHQRARAGAPAGGRYSHAVKRHPVARGDRLQRRADGESADHRAAAGFAVDPLPFPRPRVHQFDGRAAATGPRRSARPSTRPR